mgnify:CR=1 FL=1
MWDGNQQVIADVIDNQFYEADCYIRGTNLVAKYNFWNGKKSEYTYYTQNAHGDVVNLTDKDGKVTKSYKYDAFGVEKNIDKNDTNAFRYCGEYYDSESGTIYLRARYYDPAIGRFISRDSYSGKNEDPLSLNLYTYCENNPIWGIDPSGHFKLPNWVKKAAGAVKDFASSTVGKVVIGTAVIATAAIVTVATGGAGAGIAGYIAAGALKGAVVGAVSGAVVGGGTAAVKHRYTTGGWSGAGKAALDGAASGYMGGAISGAITGGASRSLQVLRNTKITSSLPKTSKPLSSVSKIKNGQVTNTRFYNIKGKARFELDFNNHGKPKFHSSIHGHKINFEKKIWSSPINNIWKSRW